MVDRVCPFQLIGPTGETAGRDIWVFCYIMRAGEKFMENLILGGFAIVPVVLVWFVGVTALGVRPGVSMTLWTEGIGFGFTFFFFHSVVKSAEYVPGS